LRNELRPGQSAGRLIGDCSAGGNQPHARLRRQRPETGSRQQKRQTNDDACREGQASAQFAGPERAVRCASASQSLRLRAASLGVGP